MIPINPLSVFLFSIWLVFTAWMAFDCFDPHDRYGDRITLAWIWQRTKHFFGVWTGSDDNFPASRKAVVEFEDTAETIECDYGDPAEDARTVEEVEAKVAGPAIRAWLQEGELARDTVWQSTGHLLGVDDTEAAFRLRLWGGCLTAAKCIATWWRRRFAKAIDESCAMDPVFHRGVRAAVAFKEGRGGRWSFFGVPTDSVVREGAIGR